MIDDINISVYGQTLSHRFQNLTHVFSPPTALWPRVSAVFITLFSLLRLSSSFLPSFLTTFVPEERGWDVIINPSLIVDCCSVVCSRTRSVVNVFCLKPIHPSTHTHFCVLSLSGCTLNNRTFDV